MKNKNTFTVTSPVMDPVTFRLPANNDRDPFFGCARSFWNQRVLPTPENNFKPPVRSIVIKSPEARRGIRLVIFASAKKYIEALAAQQEPAAVSDEGMAG